MGELTVVSLEKYGLISVEDAAARRGVSDETIRTWLRKGLPVVPVGKGRNRTVHLIPIKDLDAYQPAPVGAPEGNHNAMKVKKPRGRPKKK